MPSQASDSSLWGRRKEENNIELKYGKHLDKDGSVSALNDKPWNA